MGGRRIWVFVLAALVCCSLAVTTFASSTPVDESALRNKAVAVLEAQWNALIPSANNSLASNTLVEMTLPEALADLDSLEALVKRHYLEPAAKAGFQYTSVKVFPEFTKIEINRNTAKVDALVSVEYTSQYFGSSEEILTKESNIPYSFNFIRSGNTWLFANIESQNTFSKRGIAQEIEAPTLQEEGTLHFNDSDVQSVEVSPQWWHYYDRSAAAAYADKWWNSRNPEYRSFPADCANFVSQSFKAGLAFDARKDPYIWWYDNKGTPSTSDDVWTTSWSVAHDQAYNLSRNTDVDEHRGYYVSTASQLAIGDSIYYDFDGDGILDHSAIVVEIRNGQPYVNYHTTDTYHRHWDLNAHTTRFLHVTDYYYFQ